jgi:hypothetical protein
MSLEKGTPQSDASRWHWTIHTIRGTDEIELEPRAIRGGYRILVNGVSQGTMPAPTDVDPWIERQVRVGERTAGVVALEWGEQATRAHLFVDGIDIRDGTALETRRSRAPSPVDPFDKQVQSILESLPGMRLVGAATGAVISATTAAAITPLALLPGAIVGLVLGGGVVLLYERVICWLGSKHHWRVQTRRVLLSLVLVGPVVAILVVASVLTH